MYQGYRLKINNVIFPDIYISRGSYSCIEDERVVEIWTDANFVEHKITTGVPKATITFSLAEHPMDKHSEIVQFFQQNDGITIEYYADKRDAYRTATFRLEPITFAHKYSVGNNVLYDITGITLIEN